MVDPATGDTSWIEHCSGSCKVDLEGMLAPEPLLQFLALNGADHGLAPAIVAPVCARSRSAFNVSPTRMLVMLGFYRAPAEPQLLALDLRRIPIG